MEARALLAARKRSREKNVDLGNGKSVVITRPPEADMASLLEKDGTTATWSVGIEQVQKYVVGWKGFTEADFLPPGVGASDLVDFDASLWADLCVDNMDWTQTVARAILDAVVAHISAKESVAKNSEPA